MEIAKDVLNLDYQELELDIKFDSADWNIAINYLEKRINERFIEPINKLIEMEANLNPVERKFGFSVLALDCLLLETIQCFYEGVTDSSYDSKNIYKRFLTQREGFKEHFDDKLANEFYHKFRCGVIHQAQTSLDSKIWSVGKLISKNNNYTIVNRILFHQKITEVFNNYIKELRLKKDFILLNNFKTKMDFIAGK